MKHLILFIAASFFSLSAFSYSPRFPEKPYYFESYNKEFLVEVFPQSYRSPDNKFLLSRKKQMIVFYKKGKPAWQEISHFNSPSPRLIKNVYPLSNGKGLLVQIDENPMVRNSNTDDGLFFLDQKGKLVKAYSYNKVFGNPGIFRNSKISLNKNESLLVIEKNKVSKSIKIPKL